MVVWITRVLDFFGHVVAYLVKVKRACFALVVVLAWEYGEVAAKAGGVFSWNQIGWFKWMFMAEMA